VLVPKAEFRKDQYLDKILSGDCLGLLARMPENSVDLVLCDLPYGTTRNKWDSVIDLDELWEQWHRVAKDDAAIVLTAAQPFTSVLVTSNLGEFKVEWIWSKTVGSGQLNIKHQPLRTHESVLVFYRKPPSYHPQMGVGTAYEFTRKATYEGPGYNQQRDVEVSNPGVRYPKTVLNVANPRIKGGHPTQKPVELFEYMIATYSEPGDVVLDNCIGAGTTAVATLRAGRHFVGMELEPKYVAMAKANVAAAKRELAKKS
jgi:site-specific DNA-methyltransferase (adenine-specific)